MPMMPLQWKKKNKKTYQQIADKMGFAPAIGRNKVWRHFTGKSDVDLRTALGYYEAMNRKVSLVEIEKAMKRPIGVQR